MNSAMVQFCDFYQSFDAKKLDALEQIYATNIVFEDPAHRIVGLQNLRAYFDRLLQGAGHCDFVINSVVEQEDEAFVSWVMTFSHPKLKSGQAISVVGVSHLKFSERIDYHRDYFDLGQMLYEHIPVLGGLIRWLRLRLAG